MLATIIELQCLFLAREEATHSQLIGWASHICVSGFFLMKV
jgi:hypothetical protein